MGFGRVGCAGLGWDWGLALVDALGWVGRGFGFWYMAYNLYIFFHIFKISHIYLYLYFRCVVWGLSKNNQALGNEMWF